MEFVSIEPEALTSAAGTLELVGSALNTSNETAAAPTAGVAPAAADEVSALTAAQFVTHAARYQAISAEAAGIQHLLIATLSASASSYAATEMANAIAAH